jgi:serine/threonine-protein kinase RsbW
LHGLAARPEQLPGEAAMTRADVDQVRGPSQGTMTAEPCFLARRAFNGRSDQIRAVRRWLAPLIDGFAGAQDAVLACSELAANAIIHSASGRPGGVFTVRACIDRNLIRIEVIDQGGSWPGRQGQFLQGGFRPGEFRHGQGSPAVEDADLSGRGLTIVAAIATSWGITGDQEGRTAWCEIRAQ